MTISFRIAKHTLTGEDLVEVLHDGKVCAALYADHPDGVRIMSAHFRELTRNFPRVDIDGEGIPAITVRFDPRPYRMVDNKIVRD